MKNNNLSNFVICHYDEIGLKGRNRKFFEDQLVVNIKKKLVKTIPGNFKYVKRISGRILVKLGQVDAKTLKSLKEVFSSIFGIAHFSFAFETKQELEEIKKKALQILSGKRFKTFKIETQRSNKNFPLTSQQVNERVGEFILTEINKKAKPRGVSRSETAIGVKLNKPSITQFIEIADSSAFLYTEKIKGPGGLPVGAGGKVIVLLSGGIDSPVAAYYAMKRGTEAIFVHFHSLPHTDESSIDKVKELAGILNKYQSQSKLYLMPFAGLQKQIMLNVPEKYRIIFYRRVMLKMAEEIAKKENSKALVTGESLGQVASQTLENLNATNDAVDMLVLRPLVGFDKKEIMEKAGKIGTYEISIRPHEDCCTVFIPKHPETRANLKEVKKIAKKLDIKKSFSLTLSGAEVKNIDNL